MPLAWDFEGTANHGWIVVSASRGVYEVTGSGLVSRKFSKLLCE
jgi:hypothetical protein